MSKATTATDPLTDAIEDAEYVLEELGNALVNRLFDGMGGVNCALSAECDQKETEALALRTKHRELEPRVAAQRRLLDADVDRAIAEGRDEDAAAKRQEVAELERNLASILEQAETCERKAKELSREITANYSRTFAEVYPEIQRSCIAASVALSKMLDRTWAAILDFESESGSQGNRGFVRGEHRAYLTPDEKGWQGPYFVSLRRWFGGRQ